jgi:phospholipid/cholesterol/gamma-HCH transport system substrate-binding protein
MADRKKVRWSQLKIGIIAGTAFVILFILVFLLTSAKNPFSHYALLRTYMDNAAGLPDGTEVRLNGIIIGFLETPRLTESRDPKRAVEFDMMVKPDFVPQIPEDSTVAIAASTLLGGKIIDITKGVSKVAVKPGAELRSAQLEDIPQLMGEMKVVLDSLQTIVVHVDNLLGGIEQGKGNIGKLLKDQELYDRLNGIAAEGQKLLTDVRTANGTLGKLIYDDTLYRDLDAPLKRVDSMIADLQGGQGTAGKLLKDPALYDEARQSLSEIHTLLNELNAGKGTAGKLVKDEQLYTRMDDLVAKFNVTVDKINAGQGTLGQFVVNPQLYDALNGATREFQSLAKDMRANPKKFLSLRLALF